MKYRTILFEDNVYVRNVFLFILEERGHEVFSYEDPADCPLFYWGFFISYAGH